MSDNNTNLIIDQLKNGDIMGKVVYDTENSDEYDSDSNEEINKSNDENINRIINKLKNGNVMGKVVYDDYSQDDDNTSDNMSDNMSDKNDIKKITINTNKNSIDENDVEYIVNTLENENNLDIISYTKQEIKTKKNDVFQKLNVDRETLLSFHKKLKDYRFIDDIHEVKHGSYIRWINLQNIKLSLTNGGIVTTILYDKEESDNSVITIKNNRNRFLSIKFDNIVLFQKLSEQENFLLDVMKYIE